MKNYKILVQINEILVQINEILVQINALSPNSTYLAGMNRLIICDRLALLQSLISSTR